MTHYEALLALLLAQPPCYVEQPDETRPARLEMVAHELAQLPQQTAIGLATQGWIESKWARYVWEGCREIPKGQGDCDRGRASGPWQVHRGTCSEAWSLPVASPERLHAEVLCAARVWQGGTQRCRTRGVPEVQGGFSGFMGSCTWKGAERRAHEYEDTLARYLRLKARAAE